MSSEARYIEKIISLLERGQVHIKIVPKTSLPKGTWGTANKIKKKIKILNRLQVNAQVFTLVHECLHILMPKKSEAWVRPRAYHLWGVMSEAQHEKLKDFLRGLS